MPSIKHALVRIKNPALVALAAAAAIMVTSCKDKGIHGDTGHETMGAYAAGYNILIDEIPNLLDRYFKNTPPDGPTLKSLTDKKTWLCSGRPFMEMKRKKASEAFEKGKGSANAELKHLVPMADALWTASMEVSSLSEEYCKYIEAEDFKDDQGAKAKEFHARWVAAAEKYSTAQGKFSDELDKIEDQQMVADIEKHAKDKGYGYWFRQFNFKAKQFVAKVRSDRANLSAHTAELEPAYNDLSSFSKEKGASLNSSFKSYQRDADSFFAEVKKMNRAVAEAKDDEARSKAVEDGFDDIVRDYNSLVSMHNSLVELEGYGQLK